MALSDQENRVNAQCALWTYIDTVKRHSKPFELDSRASWYGKTIQNYTVETEFGGKYYNGLRTTRTRDKTIGKMTKNKVNEKIATMNMEVRENDAKNKRIPTDGEINEVLKNLTNMEMTMLTPFVNFIKYRPEDTKKEKRAYVLNLAQYNANTMRETLGLSELTKKKTEETRTCSKYTHYIKENSK